jgi:lipopolysaccharide/colanic/teichoic acid biosynthesis glycosyltransferase
MNPTLETRIRSEVINSSGTFTHSNAPTASLTSLSLSQAAIEALTGDRARRVLNVAIAGLALILVSPLLLLLALLVKLTSPGPVFYTQTRVGVDRRDPLDAYGNGRRKVNFGGKLFRIYKFRTMRPSTDSATQVWASPNDSRITPIGRVLRKYRLDELPQLVNVLRGEMNIVGPRPEQPNIFMQLRGEIDGYDQRQRVLPGITGLAQISHHYDACVDDVRRKLSFDLEYIGRESALEDLRILLRTVPVILFRKGAW